MYIAVDADSVGKVIDGLILEMKLEELKVFSLSLTQHVLSITDFITKNGGEIYLSGGDNILAFDLKYEDTIELIKKLNSQSERILFSVGLGSSVHLASMALKYAKISNSKKFVHSSSSDQGIDFKCIP